MKLGTFLLSKELLGDLLNLPEGARVVGVDSRVGDREMRVYVEHSDFPEVGTWSEAARCLPVFRTYYQQAAQCESWGMED